MKTHNTIAKDLLRDNRSVPQKLVFGAVEDRCIKDLSSIVIALEIVFFGLLKKGFFHIQKVH